MRYPLGLLTSIVLILWGIWIFYLGIVGALTWSIETFGFDSAIVDGSVGAFMMLVGLYILWLIQYRLS